MADFRGCAFCHLWGDWCENQVEASICKKYLDYKIETGELNPVEKNSICPAHHPGQIFNVSHDWTWNHGVKAFTCRFAACDAVLVVDE